MVSLILLLSLILVSFTVTPLRGNSQKTFQDRVAEFTQEQATQMTRHYASRYTDEAPIYWLPLSLAILLLFVLFVFICWCSTVKPLCNTLWWLFFAILIIGVGWFIFTVPYLWIWGDRQPVDDDNNDFY